MIQSEDKAYTDASSIYQAVHTKARWRKRIDHRQQPSTCIADLLRLCKRRLFSDQNACKHCGHMGRTEVISCVILNGLNFTKDNDWPLIHYVHLRWLPRLPCHELNTTKYIFMKTALIFLEPGIAPFFLPPVRCLPHPGSGMTHALWPEDPDPMPRKPTHNLNIM